MKVLMAGFAAAILAAVMFSAVNAQVLDTGSGYVVNNAAYLQASLVNQDPYPAEPGGYADLLFKIENIGTEKADNVTFELVPYYPFSLEPGSNPVTWIGSIGSYQKDNNAFQVKCRVRIDSEAVEGENDLTVKYSYGTSSYNTKTFNLTISNPGTKFEVVLQESSESSTTLAIVNIGLNNAYSVIARIPEQDGFTVTEPSSVVIGNLAGNDYTLASFQVSQSSASSGGRLFNRTQAPSGQAVPSETQGQITAKELKVEISYTDEIGQRRTVVKLVPMATTGYTATTTTSFSATRSSSTSMSQGYLYIIAGAAGIVAVIAFFLFRQRKGRKKRG